MLNEYFYSHLANPYPSEEAKVSCCNMYVAGREAGRNADPRICLIFLDLFYADPNPELDLNFVV